MHGDEFRQDLAYHSHGFLLPQGVERQSFLPAPLQKTLKGLMEKRACIGGLLPALPALFG